MRTIPFHIANHGTIRTDDCRGVLARVICECMKVIFVIKISGRLNIIQPKFGMASLLTHTGPFMTQARGELPHDATAFSPCPVQLQRVS